MAEVTVLVVGQDRFEALQLTIESFKRHNTDIDFYTHYWDNNSTDGVQDWAKANVDRVYVKDGPLGHHHAVPLDRMVADVDTPFVMTLDNDVLSIGPVLKKMLEKLRETGAFAISPAAKSTFGEVEHRGVLLKGQPRIDPCCALFRTAELARMVKHVSFCPYECANLAEFYDTGGMIRRAALSAGYQVIDANWLWNEITHYGALTWGGHAPEGSRTHENYLHHMGRVRDDLSVHTSSLVNSIEVVLAKYKEDVSWSSGLPHKVTVYDKSDNPIAGYHPLPNIGREAHTYAEHVARNYDDLPEVTVFAQGNPFDHVPNFVEELRTPTVTFRAYGPHRLETFEKGDSCHGGLPIARTFEELTNRPFPGKTIFAPGACFAAHRSALRRYPKEWWRNLADKIATAPRDDQLPWTMERLWYALLTLPPLKHIYHTIPGWFAAEDLYQRMVEEAPYGARVVEVGAWVGRSSSYLAVAAANTHKNLRVDIVDTFRGSDNPEEAHMKREVARHGGSMLPTFRKNVAPVERYLNVVEADSVSATSKYPDNSLWFVYLDASHDEESVTKDIMAWAPKVVPGGWLGGDDATYMHPGVIAAIDKCFGYNTRIDNRNWLWKKPPV